MFSSPSFCCFVWGFIPQVLPLRCIRWRPLSPFACKCAPCPEAASPLAEQRCSEATSQARALEHNGFSFSSSSFSFSTSLRLSASSAAEQEADVQVICSGVEWQNVGTRSFCGGPRINHRYRDFVKSSKLQFWWLMKWDPVTWGFRSDHFIYLKWMCWFEPLDKPTRRLKLNKQQKKKNQSEHTSGRRPHVWHFPPSSHSRLHAGIVVLRVGCLSKGDTNDVDKELREVRQVLRCWSLLLWEDKMTMTEWK